MIREKKILYRGIEFKELDVDAIIKKAPKVVLVDEFSPQQRSGSHHETMARCLRPIGKRNRCLYHTQRQHIESLSMLLAPLLMLRYGNRPDSVFRKSRLNSFS